MEIGDIVNLKAGSTDMEVIGSDNKYVRVRILFTFNSEATAAFARSILAKDDVKSKANKIRREEQKKKREANIRLRSKYEA